MRFRLEATWQDAKSWEIEGREDNAWMMRFCFVCDECLGLGLGLCVFFWFDLLSNLRVSQGGLNDGQQKENGMRHHLGHHPDELLLLPSCVRRLQDHVHIPVGAVSCCRPWGLCVMGMRA